jgi:hypothetical protein
MSGIKSVKHGKFSGETTKDQTKCNDIRTGDIRREWAVLRRVGAFGGRPRARRSPFVSRPTFWTSDADEGTTTAKRAMTEKRARKNFFMSRCGLVLNDAASGVLTRKDRGILFVKQENERNDGTTTRTRYKVEKSLSNREDRTAYCSKQGRGPYLAPLRGNGDIFLQGYPLSFDIDETY